MKESKAKEYYSEPAMGWAEKRYPLSQPKGKIIRSDRKFGIEFEFSVDRSKIASQKFVTNYIVRSDARDRNKALLPYGYGNQNKNELDEFVCGEIVTPPMRLANAEVDVKKFSDVFLPIFRYEKNCGTHIHLEAKDIKRDDLRFTRLINFYYHFHSFLMDMMPRDRKISRWCRNIDRGLTLCKNYSQAMAKLDIIGTLRYNQGLAINTTTKNQATFEVRHHESTVSHVEILNWVAMWQWIFDNCIKFDDVFIKKMRACKDTEKVVSLLVKHGLPKAQQQYMLSRLAKHK